MAHPPIRFLLTALCATLLSCNGGSQSEPAPDDPAHLATHPDAQRDSALDAQATPLSTIESAFASHTSSIQVLVRGAVVRFLSDDTVGDRHQRFILKLDNGQTLLVAHNIDLATRLPATAAGGTVYGFGEYEWNDQGGVLHWTHRDPGGSHVDGWLQFLGVRHE